MRRRTPTLTPQELAIMKIVWKAGQATVREVYEALRVQRKVAYTTILTMMKILEGKGYLSRDSEERAHVYRPTRPEQTVVRSMVRDFIDRVFNGSAQPLLLHLVRDRKLSEDEMEELRRLLEESKEGG
jgi:BlaI family transcriptional regulator, penicillinase repressor